jgi:hypothetical protein
MGLAGGLVAAALTGAGALGAAPPPPTGDARGIALARSVQAAYSTVPAIRLSGPVRAGAEAAHLTATILVKDARLVSFVGVFVEPSRTVQIIGQPDGTAFGRLKGTACWVPVSGFAQLVSRPIITIPGGTFGRPRRVGRTLVMRSREPASSGGVNLSEYRIDPRTHLILSERNLRDGTTATYEALSRAPRLPRPSPRCASSGTP